MLTFKVLTLGKFIKGSEIDISVSAFADFYHGITTKHQKQSSLHVIEEQAEINELVSKIKQESLSKAVEIIPWENQGKIEKIYKTASVLLIPSLRKLESVFSEALSFGLPILCFDHSGQEDYVDQTCGMLVKHSSPGRSIQDFSEMLQLLYFDPEARMVLKRGAKQKYETQFTWGKRQMATN